MTRIKFRFLALIVPIICLTIAGIQLYLSKTSALSLWKGGGFGMYTELHPNNTRSLWLDLGDKQISFSAFKSSLESSLKTANYSQLFPYIQAQVRSIRYYPNTEKLELLRNDLQKSLILIKSDLLIRDVYVVELSLDTASARYTAKRIKLP